MENRKTLNLTPILSVDSVDRSLAYYQDCLGFKIGFRWSDTSNAMLKNGDLEPTTFASNYLEEIEIFLSQRNQGNPGMWLCLNYVNKANLISFLDRVKKTGALIKGDLELKPWGLYEALISDLDGHFLRFGAPQ